MKKKPLRRYAVCEMDSGNNWIIKRLEVASTPDAAVEYVLGKFVAEYKNRREGASRENKSIAVLESVANLEIDKILPPELIGKITCYYSGW